MCFGLQEAWRLSRQPSSILSDGSVYSSLKVDSIKLMELLGPEKVDPSDVKLIKEKLFGYSTFWVTREEPFGDLGEGVLFLGNLRGKREDVFVRLQRQLNEVTGDKQNLFMVEELNSEGPDPRGGPRITSLPPEVVKYFTDPNATEAPDMLYHSHTVF